MQLTAQTASQGQAQERQTAPEPFAHHTWWAPGQGWKTLRKNLRLIIQPAVLYGLLAPWLGVFPLPSLHQGFQSLMAMMNGLHGFVPV
jgi:hypothetical protein